MSLFIFPFMSFPPWEFLTNFTKACSPVGLISLMDKALCPVIAKVRDGFLFQPFKIIISTFIYFFSVVVLDVDFDGGRGY